MRTEGTGGTRTAGERTASSRKREMRLVHSAATATRIKQHRMGRGWAEGAKLLPDTRPRGPDMPWWWRGCAKPAAASASAAQCLHGTHRGNSTSVGKNRSKGSTEERGNMAGHCIGFGRRCIPRERKEAESHLSGRDLRACCSGCAALCTARATFGVRH